MGKVKEFFNNPGGDVVRTSGKAIKMCLFVTCAAVALGVGVGAVQGGFSS